MLAFIAGCVCCDKVTAGYISWDGGHKENESLDQLYGLLERLGYEMSDEEKQLQNGTHPIFGKADEDSDEDEDEEE